MVGSDLSDEVRMALMNFLHEHCDLFSWSIADMPGLSPDIACHHLAVNPEAPWVAQHRRSQSNKKAEAAAKVVEDLIKEYFVKEVKYTI